MPVIEYGKLKIDIDEDGYLVNFDEWNEEVACAIAEREGIEELSQDKIDILKFTRQYYRDYGSYPVFGAVCLNVNQPKECITEKFIDPLKSWKIAGIPNPGKEVETYLYHEVV
jgi:TusE/DsrC/DsvC family sulfur relay protein